MINKNKDYFFEILLNNPYFFVINSSLNGLSFAQDSDGKWGYKVGADAVIPFKSGQDISFTYTYTGQLCQNADQNIWANISLPINFVIKDGKITISGSSAISSSKVSGSYSGMYVRIFKGAVSNVEVS